MRKPAVVAIANALFPGLGYLMLGKRRVFGALLFAGTVIYWLLIFDPGTPSLPEGSFLFAHTMLGKFAESALLLLPAIAFGYDAYQLAKK